VFPPGDRSKPVSEGSLSYHPESANTGPDARAAVPRLPAAVLDAIVACSDADLPAAVRPSLRAPSAGLCNALGKRPPPAAAQVEVCAAILGSHDPMERVDAELARFGSTAPAFLSALDAQVVRIWEREENLPPLVFALARMAANRSSPSGRIVQPFVRRRIEPPCRIYRNRGEDPAKENAKQACSRRGLRGARW
jgi:hypothetical protein